MVSSGKIPNALLFTGPSSVGKTTLARALAVAINGRPIEQQKQSYIEVNGSDKRSIEDVRDVIQMSKFRADCKRRIIMIDEVQGILTNQPAAAALLKPLEEPSKGTLWILASMDPSKFNTSNGKAVANRCTQFVLEPHTNQDLLQQAMRIAKGEKMRYIDKELLKDVVRSSANEMRTLANLMQGLRDYYDGLDDKPAMLDKEVIGAVLASTQSSDDKQAVKIIVSALAGKYAEVQRALLYTADGFQMMQKLLWLSSFLLNVTVLEGARHPKVWFSPINKQLLADLKSAGVKPSLGQLASLQANIVDMKSRAATFAVGEVELMSAVFYRTIKEMFPPK